MPSNEGRLDVAHTARGLNLPLMFGLLLAGCGAQLPAGGEARLPETTMTAPSLKRTAGSGATGAAERPASPVTTATAPEQVAATPPPPTPPSGTYTLAAEEQALDCRKLTGRIHIRIAHMRDAANRGGVSVLSRSLQSVVTPVFGGTTYGLDPIAQARRDRAQIDAYNRQLVTKGCQPVDVAAELAKPE